MKKYISPDFDIITIKISSDILTSSQEGTVPVYTDEPSPSYETFPPDFPPL